MAFFFGPTMNISRTEQRVLHVLALGGRIDATRGDRAKITEILCVTRDGLILADCSLSVFQRLRRKRLIASEGGGPYRISRLGRLSVRAQTDNQG
jgi:uncharacterized protein YjhX (UPF0386 family)